jgi:hypothetical protein
MGKAQKFKALRKVAGFKPGDEVNYNITKPHEIVWKDKDGIETGRVEAATLVAAGPRKTYQLMKTIK